MRIELNGEPRDLAEGSTVVDAVRATGADPERGGLAVAVNGEVVPRADWPATELTAGQRVEVVQAIQGGSRASGCSDSRFR